MEIIKAEEMIKNEMLKYPELKEWGFKWGYGVTNEKI